MAALLALLSALAYGVGDFFGGLSARRLPSSAVVLRTHAAGLAGLVVLLPLVEASPGGHDIVVGAAGGVAGGLGVLLFYRAMAEGAMSLVAPITSVLTAVIPVVYGLATGDRPSLFGLVGIPIALVAVTLLARDPGEATRTGLAPRQALQALGAGVGFGVFIIGLDMASDAAGLWPVIAGRTTSVTLFALVALVSPAARVGSGARTGPVVAMLVACGLLDAWANALLLFATHHGMITLVAVLGSLYPATTLLLARSVLGERLARPQLGGVALAGAAVVLVSVG
ncbi:MAG TPA: EamA family transporter [Acidimicrobiales bacterium]|nr:EamA family transporter [Acidimicrobiales bacterium]